MLGTFLGHSDFVAAHLVHVLNDHRTLLDGAHSRGAGRAVCMGFAPPRRSQQGQPPIIIPTLTEAFARGHDEGLWQCMCEILRVPSAAGLLARNFASLPLGGLGLRSASRSRQSAKWASWADTLSMVRSRYRATAEAFVEVLETGVGPVSLVAAEDCRRNMTGVMGV